jgi:Phage tail sheath C-terminal domain
MASLVSAGVSVTITDESFFIPAAARTVPLIFLATADEKKQPNGTTAAAGTYEHNVIRTVTSLKQSTELYGIPRFLTDTDGNPMHGDARNEYGLFALNQFLGVGNMAYAVRANVNLDDSIENLRLMWDDSLEDASIVLENLVASYINEYNRSNGLIASSTNAIGSTGIIVGGAGYTNGTYTNVPLVASKQILTLGAVVGGSAYTDGTYTNIPLTGGTGTDARATVVVSGGAVTTVTLTSSGVGFTAGDVLSALVANLGGTGSGFTVPVATIGTVSGSGATATITVTAGAVSAVVITAGGLGYTVGNSLTAATANIGGTGSGFKVPVATLSGYKQTVTGAELTDLVNTAMVPVWDKASFSALTADFMNDHTANPLEVYPNGYNNAAVGAYLGFAGIVADWETTGAGGLVAEEWTADEAGNTLLGAGDDFKFTLEFYNKTSLGANDAARRVSIVTALAAAINSNTDLRSDTYEYNLILCPGYHELADEMMALSQDVQDEVMVIVDTPFDKDPDDVVTWAATSARKSSPSLAYYYPHSLASNLDGKNVFVAASGTALRTITYSDEISELWFAPAGTRRGLVSGVSQVGYVSGTLGTATTFVEAALNVGQRDNMYKYYTNLNPIVFFPGRGILVWGQKTSAPDASALDRINVSRLLMYIKRQLRKNTMSFVFEPNDQLTRDNIKAVVDGFLGDLIVKRGLYDFATICDESNNTPDRIDRNELYVDIALKPVKAAEFIYIPIRVLATGAEL